MLVVMEQCQFVFGWGQVGFDDFLQYVQEFVFVLVVGIVCCMVFEVFYGNFDCFLGQVVYCVVVEWQVYCMFWYVVMQCMVFVQGEVMYQVLGSIQCSVVVQQVYLECWQCIQVVLWVIIGVVYFQVFFQVYFWECGGYVV